MTVTGAPPLQNSRGVGRPGRSKTAPIGPYCQPVSQAVVADLALIIVDPRGRRASFDGNASHLALLCTPSCRNTPGPPARVPSLATRWWRRPIWWRRRRCWARAQSFPRSMYRSSVHSTYFAFDLELDHPFLVVTIAA